MGIHKTIVIERRHFQPLSRYASNLLKVTELEMLGVLMKYVATEYILGVSWLLRTLDVNMFKRQETKFFHDLVVRVLKESKR